MRIDLKNKVALVTGARIGKAIASLLADEAECSVVLVARGHIELEKTAKEFLEKVLLVFPVIADVAKTGDIKKLVLQLIAKFKTIHILVNNAGGIHEFLRFEELND